MEISSLYEIFRRCGSVTTDSRAISGGELFFALRGENFDGNLFAGKALEAGAAYAVVEEDSNIASLAGDYPDAFGGSRIIPVKGTLSVLQALARYHRENVGGSRRLPVIGITGTNGKTTTKELIRTVLSGKYNVLATEGNLNNDIGVPLTLLKLRQDTEIAVVEMGASHPDDIAKLVKVCEPDYGIITNVGKAHLQGFGSFDGVKAAKGKLYDYLNGQGGTAFVNADDADIMEMISHRPDVSEVRYGLSCDGFSLMEITEQHPFVRLRNASGYILETSLTGAYNAANILAALCIGSYFGVPQEVAYKAVSSYVPSNSRSQIVRTGDNVLIVDAYNANPSSMRAALQNFALMHSAHRVAMLGDMRELGAPSVEEHIGILELALSSGTDVLCFVGEEFGKALKAVHIPDNADVRWYPDSESLADEVRKSPFRDSLILVKGSRGIRMEKVIPSL